MMVRRALDRLQPEFPSLEVKEIDIMIHPGTAWKNNIRMIPTLVCGEQRLSGIYLSTARVRSFLARCRGDAGSE
ncbi:MAG TPA: hypothetical protein ENK27_13880 [Desulfobulbus sp.]|nr:hypothetical protein [Desulfobulbus sp.]